MSASLYNVHEPANGSYAHSMSRSEHLNTNCQPMIHQKSVQRFMPTVSSQSESNIPNLPSHSPTYYRPSSRISKQFAFIGVGYGGVTNMYLTWGICYFA